LIGQWEVDNMKKGPSPLALRVFPFSLVHIVLSL